MTPFEQGAWERTWRTAVDAGGTFVIVGLAYLILRDWIDAPISFFQLWDTKGSLLSGLASVWPLFAWGIGVTLVIRLVHVIRRTPRDYEPGYYLQPRNHMRDLLKALIEAHVRILRQDWWHRR